MDFTKKYLVFRCFPLFLVELKIPFCSNRMALWLPCKITTVFATWYPSSNKKCLILRACGIPWWTATNSPSVEPLVLTFCLQGTVNYGPLPIVEPYPIWHLQLSYKIYTAFIEHVAGIVLSLLSVEGNDQVWLRYLITFLCFFQSLSLGLETLIINKGTVGAISGLVGVLIETYLLYCHVTTWHVPLPQIT